jgi:hypothetical protein
MKRILIFAGVAFAAFALAYLAATGNWRQLFAAAAGDA